MSFVAGLIAGLFIAGVEVALEHYGPSFGPFSLSGNGAFAAPAVLVPLMIFWGWSWVANRWSGRSLLPTVLYTAGLYLGVGAVSPIDAVLFPQSEASTLMGSLPGLLLSGLVFVLPAALIAGALFWALKSDRLPTNALTLLVGYLVGLPFAVLVPMITMGTVAGVATGHAWQRPGARTMIALLVIVLMLIAVFGIPYVLYTQITGEPPRPALPTPLPSP